MLRFFGLGSEFLAGAEAALAAHGAVTAFMVIAGAHHHSAAVKPSDIGIKLGHRPYILADGRDLTTSDARYCTCSDP